MKITLITACYNSASVIRTAIESVLRQTWPEIEYLVVDGGSTDGTVEIIREYETSFAGRMRWVSERDKGFYDAINKGIQRATGEVVGILNADDVMADDHVIERVAEAFGKCVNALMPDCVSAEVREEKVCGDKSTRYSGKTAEYPPEYFDVLYGDIRFVANRTDIGLDALREEKTLRYYSSKYFRPWLMKFGYLPAHPTFYCRRQLFRKYGSYQTDYKIAADHELLIRFLVKRSIRSRYLPGVFVVMRKGGMSTRSVQSTLIINRENIRACRTNGIYTNQLMQLARYLFKIPGLVFRNGY